MDATDQLAIKLYLQTQVLSGFIYNPSNDRLLDILSGISVKRPESRAKFLELTNVTVQHADGTEEILPTVCVNKAAIELATTSDVDSARGLGTKVGPKPYPFVEKLVVPVRLQMSGYAITGSLHRAHYQRVWHVLDEKSTFLPITNADIAALANGDRWKAPFVAVNQEQILFLREEAPSTEVPHPESRSGT